MVNQEVVSTLKTMEYDGSCKRRQVKCIAVDPSNFSVIGIGYNKSMVGCKTCYREKNNIPSGTQPDICGATHAEQDLICNYGNKLENSHVYITHKPCITCLKMLINCNVKKIFYIEDYPTDSFFYDKILRNNDVDLIKI